MIGTHTSNEEQNYLQIVKVKIPLESSKDTREYREGLDEGGAAQQNQNQENKLGGLQANKDIVAGNSTATGQQATSAIGAGAGGNNAANG